MPETSLIARLEPLPTLQELQLLWQSVMPATGASFFTSWGWIEAWLLELKVDGEYRLLRIRRDELTVAVGIFVIATVRRRHRLPRRVIHLHATGDPDSDSVHIEQNDLLVRGSVTQDIYDAALQCLMDCGEPWDELDLQGIANGHRWVNAARRFGLLIDVERQCAPRVVLDQLVAGKPLWHSVHSQNARYQLRRSLTDYARLLGPLSVVEPANEPEVLAFLGELARLHDKRWSALGVRSPFIAPRAMRFHKRLVTAGFASRRARICRVVAGPATVGYLYLLMHDGVANFYQSGFDYHLLERHNQPGWLCFQLIIDMMRSERVHLFEFLTGKETYKHRLANDVAARSWVRLTRPMVRFRGERSLVWIARSVRRTLRLQTTVPAGNLLS